MQCDKCAYKHCDVNTETIYCAALKQKASESSSQVALLNLLKLYNSG